MEQFIFVIWISELGMWVFFERLCEVISKLMLIANWIFRMHVK